MLRNVDELIIKTNAFDESILFSEGKIQRIVQDFNSLEEKGNIQRFSRLSSRTPTDISSETKANLRIALFLEFLSKFGCSLSQILMRDYVARLSGDTSVTGTLLAVGPIAALLSTFVMGYLSKKSYYFSFILLNLVFCAAFACFMLADYYESITLLALSRVLVGFGSSGIVSKQFLVHYLPAGSIGEYAFSYMSVSIIGLMAGPLVVMGSEVMAEFVVGDISFDYLNLPALLALSMAVLCLAVTAVTLNKLERTRNSDLEEEIIGNSPILHSQEMDRIDRRVVKIGVKQQTSGFSYLKAASVVLFTFIVLANVYF